VRHNSLHMQPRMEAWHVYLACMFPDVLTILFSVATIARHVFSMRAITHFIYSNCRYRHKIKGSKIKGSQNQGVTKSRGQTRCKIKGSQNQGVTKSSGQTP